jgi:hypothetical protein
MGTLPHSSDHQQIELDRDDLKQLDDSDGDGDDGDDGGDGGDDDDDGDEEEEEEAALLLISPFRLCMYIGSEGIINH